MNHNSFKIYHQSKDKKLNSKVLISLYSFMKKLRICEDQIEKEYHPNDQMKCPIHFCTGQEAVPASLYKLVKKDDYLFSHHRSHGYYLSKGSPIKRLFAELYGKKSGANSGLAGSQDISFPEKKFFSGAILAGAASIAVGTALALKKDKKKNVVITGFGESATDQGIFWESLNYAGLKKLPILFICENNIYSTYSPQKERQSGKSISERAKTFNVSSKSIFGNDVCLVYKEIEEALHKIRNNKGPFLLETFTYRYSSHVGPLSDDFNGYRSLKEIENWRKKCPILLLERFLIKKKLLNHKKISKIDKQIKGEIKNCFDFAKKSKFPHFNNWKDLNLFNEKKRTTSKRLLPTLKPKKLDLNQKIVLPKGY